MTNWKRLYTDASKMLAMYQDEIVPGLRKQLENRVEVVRCKDCSHRTYIDMGEDIGLVGGCGLFGTPIMGCDDFCSFGERKGNETV